MVMLRLSFLFFQFMLIFLALGNIQALDLKGFETTTTGKITARDEGGVTKMEIDVPTAMWDGFSFDRKMMMKLDQVLYTHEASNVSGATHSDEKSKFEVAKPHPPKNN
ncbi:hypothetical protein LIER_37122 [Lithospermum erythrorhizon]|uniref:Uncharacterized protein n=1 Tax=Lithospermum erythrorhizon TaxID=34254 RepID=A0AAV3PHI7_LITER